MTANAWMHAFHEIVRRQSEKLAQCELEKGDLEATILLIGSKVISLFPGDIQEGEQVPSVVIRLLEELDERRKKEKT